MDTRSVTFSGIIVYETAQLHWLSRLRWAWTLFLGKELRLDVREIVIYDHRKDEKDESTESS